MTVIDSSSYEILVKTASVVQVSIEALHVLPP